MNVLERAWQSRTDGERRAIAGLGAAAALVLVVAFAWLPLERARARDAQALPALRASLATMERDAAEVKRLKAVPARGGAAVSSLPSLAASNPVPGSQLAAIDDKRMRLTASDVGYAALVEGLASMAASHGLHAESAKIESLPTAGRVSADITLARP
jgi:type II secretory pathway component PulM